MKKIFHVYMDDLGGVEGMFDKKSNLLGAWSVGDAHWREEFFNPMMTALGVEVITANPTDAQKDAIKKYLGF